MRKKREIKKKQADRARAEYPVCGCCKYCRVKATPNDFEISCKLEQTIKQYVEICVYWEFDGKHDTDNTQCLAKTFGEMSYEDKSKLYLYDPITYQRLKDAFIKQARRDETIENDNL